MVSAGIGSKLASNMILVIGGVGGAAVTGFFAGEGLGLGDGMVPSLILKFLSSTIS